MLAPLFGALVEIYLLLEDTDLGFLLLIIAVGDVSLYKETLQLKKDGLDGVSRRPADSRVFGVGFFEDV